MNHAKHKLIENALLDFLAEQLDADEVTGNLNISIRLRSRPRTAAAPAADSQDAVQRHTVEALMEAARAAGLGYEALVPFVT